MANSPVCEIGVAALYFSLPGMSINRLFIKFPASSQLLPDILGHEIIFPFYPLAIILKHGVFILSQSLF
jgi:hypothetical protein